MAEQQFQIVWALKPIKTSRLKFNSIVGGFSGSPESSSQKEHEIPSRKSRHFSRTWGASPWAIVFFFHGGKVGNSTLKGTNYACIMSILDTFRMLSFQKGSS